MESVYLLCAVVGGAILVLQTLLLVLGVGGDADAHGGDLHDGSFDTAHADGSDALFKLLSLKTLTACLAFFGLAGLGALHRGWSPTAALLAALGAGVVALFVVAYLLAGLTKLQSKGNVDLANAVGTRGRVHLRVPAAQAGRGKVILHVQGRALECKAVTRGAEIPTGAQVTVVGAPAVDTVEVQAIE